MRRQRVTCPLSLTHPQSSRLHRFKTAASKLRPRIQRLRRSAGRNRLRAIARPEVLRFAPPLSRSRPPSATNCWPRLRTISVGLRSRRAAMLGRRNSRRRIGRVGKRLLTSRLKTSVAPSPPELRLLTNGKLRSTRPAMPNSAHPNQTAETATPAVVLAAVGRIPVGPAAAAAPAAVLAVRDPAARVFRPYQELSSVPTSASTVLGRDTTPDLTSVPRTARPFAPRRPGS